MTSPSLKDNHHVGGGVVGGVGHRVVDQMRAESNRNRHWYLSSTLCLTVGAGIFSLKQP